MRYAQIESMRPEYPVGGFLKAIPEIRNEYAHGSEMLYQTVLHTFSLVSQMINQLYPVPEPEKAIP